MTSINYLKKLAKKSAYRLIKNPLSKRIYSDEISQRSKLKFTDIHALSKNINILSPYSSEIHMPNDFYGHAKVLKAFLGFQENYKFKFIIEHGIFLSEYVGKLELDSGLPSAVTSSYKRSHILKNYFKKVFSIGPIIYYAKNYLSNESIRSEKKKKGKTLLALPSHATLDVEDQYDISEFCQKIKKVGKNYKTIRVCLYWKDILNGMDKKYKEYGFEIVTAGHLLDPLFLPRLKTIIELSDVTISNDAGTHVGYCLLQNKPHFIFLQKHNLVGKQTEVDTGWMIRKNKKSMTPYFDVLNIFSKNSSFKITPQMKEIVNKYWGISQIKSKTALLKFVEDSERIYQNA